MICCFIKFLNALCIFVQTKQALGGRVRAMTSGAAPLPRYVEEFLMVTCCSTLSQGYGMRQKGNSWFLTSNKERAEMNWFGTIFGWKRITNDCFPCDWIMCTTGLTESCGGCFTSVGNVWSMVGTVGVPMPSIEVRLESVPDMGYDALSSTAPRGEICLRGITLFSGYHKRRDLTDQVMADGWFHTGKMRCSVPHLNNK